MDPNTYHNPSPIRCFVRTYMIALTEMLSKMSISVLELDARYNWRASMHCSPFLTSDLCVLTCITWKLQVIYGHSVYRTTALILETFLVCIRVAWEIQLESYGPRHTSVILWYNIVCVYCKPLHSSLFAAQLCMRTKSTYLIRAMLTRYTAGYSVISINRVC